MINFKLIHKKKYENLLAELKKTYPSALKLQKLFEEYNNPFIIAPFPQIDTKIFDIDYQIDQTYNNKL